VEPAPTRAAERRCHSAGEVAQRQPGTCPFIDISNRRKNRERKWMENAPISRFFSKLRALLSALFIEKPALQLKDKFPSFDFAEKLPLQLRKLMSGAAGRKNFAGSRFEQPLKSKNTVAKV
jgi:hypothetical protein